MPRPAGVLRLAVGGLLAVVACCGCGKRPHAPALRDSPVYRNGAEGFRFLVPEGWLQTASSVLPPGELQGQSFLVRYRIRSPEPGAMLQIECMSDAPQLDLRAHHAGASYGAPRWQESEPPRELQVHGVATERFIYTASQAGRKITKEVVCFRRRNRVYSFVGMFRSTDDPAREQIRRAVESTIWDH